MERNTQQANREIEAKFAIDDLAYARVLQTAPTLTKHCILGPPEAVSHLDCYFDTADYALLRHGYALRLRQTEDGSTLTVKSLSLSQSSPVHHRLEIEAPTSAVDGLPLWHDWPEALRSFVEQQVGARPVLQPVCLLQQTRHKRTVTPAPTAAQETAPFAELSIDEVHILALDSPSTPTKAQPGNAVAWVNVPRLTTFWELEAELLPGCDVHFLHSLVRRLMRSRSLTPQAFSKFERALSLVHEHLRLGDELVAALLPEMQMADACRMIWRRHLGQLLLNEAGVRHSSDIEYVHDMRVAVRRMRTALRFYGDFFRGKRIERFRKALRTTGRRLGAVRDHDVALARLRRDTQSEDAAGEAEYQRIVTVWEAERSKAVADLLGWLDSAAYHRFLATFSKFCATAGKGVRRNPINPAEAPAPNEVRHVMPTLLIHQFSQVRAFESQVSSHAATPETLHLLRIQCKFLRYNLEFVQPLLGRSGVNTIKALKELQECLGELNDAVVSRQMLGDVAGADHAVERYDAAQEALVTEQRNAVQSTYAAFISPAQRRLFGRAIMRI